MSNVQTMQPINQVVPAGEGNAIVHMIERAARDPSVDIDKLERLIAMRERMDASERERAFDTALALAQAEMRPVAADANNPQTRSRYASYHALDKAVRPIYTKHGFSLSFDTGDGAPEAHVRVLCRVSCAGHTRMHHIDMPADGKGAKGGDVMTKTHAAGSAVSYGSRYLLKMIFNIAVGESDDDGNRASTGDVLNAEQLANVQSLIVETGSDIARFCKYFKVERIEDISARKYVDAVRMLEAKRGQA
jgi:hypothetical protein